MSNNMIKEIRFLRHFYSNAGTFFGPADSECYRIIKQQYLDKGNDELPVGYEMPEEEDDD